MNEYKVCKHMGWTPQAYRGLSADDQMKYRILVTKFEEAQQEAGEDLNNSDTQVKTHGRPQP